MAALLARHGGNDAAVLITQLCSDLLDAADARVPVNLDVLASFRNARVKVLDQEQAETITWDGKRFVIRVRRADTERRQRFSCAHGILHTFFMEAGTPSRKSDDLVDTSWSRQEEQLCDHGAAELLLPRTPFIELCPRQPTMDDVLDLVAEFDASTEATALRVVTLSAGPAAMVVLEPQLKPVEIKQVPCRQARPTTDDKAIRPRLRVQKSLSHGLPFIPRHKSIDDSTPLAAVLSDEVVDYTGQTGLVPGQFRVSARRLPIRRGGILIDRVIALLFDPYAERDTRRMRRSG